MGCLSQRYKDELEAELPEVDKFYGKFNYKQLLTDLGKADVPACNGVRHLTTPRHYAYVKIAEGCDRHCAYCAIPFDNGSASLTSCRGSVGGSERTCNRRSKGISDNRTGVNLLWC